MTGLAADLEQPGPAELRAVYGCFPTGVTALCALSADGPIGLAASSFNSVSMSPPLVSVCVQDSSETWPKLRVLPRLGVSVLAEHQSNACRALSGKRSERFSGLEWLTTTDGEVLISAAAAWLGCSLHKEVRAGDHTIAVLRVHGVRASARTPPLVFHASAFRRLAEPLALEPR